MIVLPSCGPLLVLIAQFAEGARLIAPVPLDFDPDVEVNRRTEEVFDFLAGQVAYFFEDRAVLADDDALLRIPFDIDRDPDIDLVVTAVLHFFDIDGDGMRHFIAGTAEELFPDDFSDQKAFRLVRDHVVREILGPFRQDLAQFVDDGIDVVPFQGGNGDDLGERIEFGIFRNLVQYLFFRHEVDFVDDQEDRDADVFQLIQDEEVARALLFIARDEEQDGVDVAQGLIGRFIHEFPQLMFRLVDARRVEEDDLTFVVRMDTEDAVARRLGLIGDNRDFMLDDAVDECRLADIRAADDGDETRFK